MFGEAGIIYGQDVGNAQSVAQRVQVIFEQKGLKTKSFAINEMDPEVELAVVIGGDGTILKAARFYCEFGIPVVGINLGRLGFLSQINPAEIELVADSIVEKNYEIQERLMLFEENTKISALNDIVIKSADTGRTSRFVLSINGKNLCDYLADGLIVSTPTGSTAYNLSAGGPVIAPEMEVFVITAICPHTLGARPLVVPADELISITTSDSDGTFLVTADGQNTKEIASGAITIIKKHSKKAKLFLIRKDGNDFYSVLRNKLHWGKAPCCKND